MLTGGTPVTPFINVGCQRVTDSPYGSKSLRLVSKHWLIT